MIVQLLEIKTAKSYLKTIKNITNEFVGFEKDIKFIDRYTIEKCSLVRKIIIPNTVKSISDKAFEHCYLLEKIIVSSSVIYIGYFVFDQCLQLKEVVMSRKLSIYVMSHVGKYIMKYII